MTKILKLVMVLAAFSTFGCYFTKTTTRHTANTPAGPVQYEGAGKVEVKSGPNGTQIKF